MSNLLEMFHIDNDTLECFDNAIEKWGLTKSDLIEGCDGFKFHDKLESISDAFEESITIAIIRKTCDKLRYSDWEYSDSSDIGYGVIVEDPFCVEHTVQSLDELDRLVFKK